MYLFINLEWNGRQLFFCTFHIFEEFRQGFSEAPGPFFEICHLLHNSYLDASSITSNITAD